MEKVRLYAETDVSEYWIVDPEERHFEFLTNRGGAFQVGLAADNVYRSPAFPEITINLAEFWAEVEARLP